MGHPVQFIGIYDENSLIIHEEAELFLLRMTIRHWDTNLSLLLPLQFSL